MKFKVLVSGMMVLATLFTSQAGVLSPKAMPFDDFNVEALPPDRGTVRFIAQTGESPASGVEIRVDGGSEGFTGEDGKLKVEWLTEGKHPWEAFYEGKEVSQGEFEVPRIVDIEIIDLWYEVEGEKVEKLSMKDTLDAILLIKNTGTTVINNVKWETGTRTRELKIVQPNILKAMGKFISMLPLFAYDLLIPVSEVGEEMEVGLRPGETGEFHIVKTMVEWAELELADMGLEMTAIDDTIVTVKEFKYGPAKYENVQIDVSGIVEDTVEIHIDDKIFTKSYIYEIVKAE